jgi:hypothetical protein
VESALGVGQLTSLELLNPASGKTTAQRVHGRWLGWSPKKRQFLICKILRRNPGKVSSGIERAHRRFHQAPSSGSFVVDAPAPQGKLQQVGLVKALTYQVPDSVKSPGKNRAHWHHAFGDTGHKGGVYTPKVMPALCRDAKGNLFIKRRKGNIFTVDTWLRG